MFFFYDACAVIYLVEGIEPWYSGLRAMLARHGGAQARHAVSELTLLECRVKPLRQADTALLARFDHFFASESLLRIPLDHRVVASATEIRARTGLKTPDALQAASALSLPADVLFLTNDQRFNIVPGLKAEIIG